ncbi:RHS repeat domain-containing protein [Spongiimicrobium sp. 2-473A-2-J]|uniref:RHS repeat domain-containing protein n=1 Tax=Eudoraea algarum TaxID=3417568 RepID=UPI003D36C071
MTTKYAGNYIYESSSLQFFNHAEGYVEPNGSNWDYVYQYKDHLGNIRLAYHNSGTASNPTLQIREENNYYPFGLKHKGYNGGQVGRDHKYGFGGKEEQDDAVGGSSLDWLDFGARNYDAALGRWMNLDPLAELMRRHSPYNYAFNNPEIFIDPDGQNPLSTHTDQNGNVLAVYNDGDNNVYKHDDAKTKADVDKKRSAIAKGGVDGKKGGVRITSGGGEKVGETEYWDEFRSHDNETGEILDEVIPGAKIEFGESWDETVKELNESSSQMSLKQIAGESVTNGDFDIKSNKKLAPSGAGTGKLLNGKYATARSAGNFLAGMNGATGKTGQFGGGFHISKSTYMKMAGALHNGNWNAWNAGRILFFGKAFGPAPYFGEIPYAGRQISSGFDAGVNIRN